MGDQLLGNFTPSFRVHRNGSNQTGVVTATITKIQFNSIATSEPTIEGWDTHSAFDLVTNFRYTPKQPGVWKFGVSLRFIAVLAGTSVVTQIIKNGGATFLGATRSIAVGVTSPIVYVEVPMMMNGSTDYVEFYCFQDSGVNQDVNGVAGVTMAWGYLLPSIYDMS